MTTLSEHYFGELEAFDEAKLNEVFFDKTFVVPSSLSMDSLRNNRKFIIVGRKGAGKTAVQMRLSEQLRNKGYFTHSFRFFYDLRSDDYAEISKTQSEISYSNVTNQRSIFLHYDFRDIWERVFFQKIANTLIDNGHNNLFTSFVEPKNSFFSNIFDGISRSLTVKLLPQMGPIAAEIGIDLSKIERSGEISLKSFNKICRSLFAKHCVQFQFYFFVDELVFSRLDAKEDEITLRAAMVRDIIRTIWELNAFSYSERMEFHFICSIRPEVRNLINDLDSESGKYLDGKDVELNWIMKSSNERSLIHDVLIKKVEYSYLKPISFHKFFTKTISFGSKTYNIEQFLRDNTWGRPRDVVRLLIAIQKKSPNAERISEDEIKAALDEYSRMSLKELVDELGVTFGHQIIDAIKSGVRRKTYKDADSFWKAINIGKLNLNKDRFIKELFNLGLIGGYIPESGSYYWAHRGETYLKPDHHIFVHAGLWNELSIRSS
ncbi:P-loop ATPase, Sll1717 family [Rhizobium leguminosarum]|uniref:P-loop ATPase, Sll1717 family n=1 Tax=Rhizobium leguminosarum TaxID=384 RepID=UPI003F96DCB8